MTLSTILAPEVSSKVRKNGQDYYRYGRVRILQGSDSSVQAQVRGSETYRVELNFAMDDALVVSCECIYFEDKGACKHVWATILAAEGRGFLAKAAAVPGLMLDDFSVVGDNKFQVPSSPRDLVLVPPGLDHRKIGRLPVWRSRINSISTHASAANNHETWPIKRQILYIVGVEKDEILPGFVIYPESRDLKQDGSWGRSKTLNLKRSQLGNLPVAEDREILSLISGAKQYYGWSYSDSFETLPTACHIRHPFAATLMPMLARTGRCYLRTGSVVSAQEKLGAPLVWDEGEPWRFALDLRRNDKGNWIVGGSLRRGGEQMDVSTPTFLTQGGLVFTPGRVAALAEDTPLPWLLHLRKNGMIEAPDQDRDELLSNLLGTADAPPLTVPEELRYEEIRLTPIPYLQVTPIEGRSDGRLQGFLSFTYQNKLVPHHDRARGWFDAEARRFIARGKAEEEAAAGLLGELGAKFHAPTNWEPESCWEIAPTKLPRMVRGLVEAGWRVEAEGKVFKRPGNFSFDVSSGVDWFELRGEVQYGEITAQLPQLLQALRRGENIVRLDNGEYGILPEEWLRRFGHLAGMGKAVNGHLRFQASQVGLLDALLAAQPEATCDETFTRVRQELCNFRGVEPAEQPSGFVGQLRDYQREGLGWMHFLRRFSFGGCLADDMGVGKTAQVLALLEYRRESKGAQDPHPSLVVVPRSLVFNWKLEAARFTPRLQVLDHTGGDRNGSNFADYDLVLTTYGTLRRDALQLKEVEFDYVILDEAQAVKNANTESSKAVRLLKSCHRLALSGTPIENHLGELWTLFEFLNPGMLGHGNAFKLASGANRNLGEDARRLLAGALRPFILRRTKEQVARELPSKTEQTIYCEMEPGQRKLYNELLQHYRNSLLKRIEKEGMAKSKIQVLEALLRLRQAACHPGLLDQKRSNEPSAKLDSLLEHLQEVMEEGHKALVFSQFTSLLAIVRQHLDTKNIRYEYLDGATHNRQAHVENFQNNPDCRLFLISLKAGGLGLNLTAAEYVFLLDPWWNPAAEAQAVDRAHRIGQTKQVFAYRLIARDTVEEKVLELQKTKRDLASAIISADNSLIGGLQREDLELLLS